MKAIERAVGGGSSCARELLKAYIANDSLTLSLDSSKVLSQLLYQVIEKQDRESLEKNKVIHNLDSINNSQYQKIFEMQEFKKSHWWVKRLW